MVGTINSLGLATGLTNGQSTITFTVLANGLQGSATLTVTPSPVVTITTTTLPGGTVGVAYNQSIAIAGGTAPYACTTSGGSLPPGLTWQTFDSGMSWRLVGNPTLAGTYSFTLLATDSSGPALSDTQAYNNVVIVGGTTTTTSSSTTTTTTTTSTTSTITTITSTFTTITAIE